MGSLEAGTAGGRPGLRIGMLMGPPGPWEWIPCPEQPHPVTTEVFRAIPTEVRP